MNNEPVAFVTGVRQFDPVLVGTVLKVGTPLYTHPAKTLTDEEIIEVWGNIEETYSEEYDARVFARAILRKAQEK
jgi:hypothetical protein